MTTLVIATRNRHKVQEIQAVLGMDFRYLTLTDLPPAPATEEDADTFAGNATKKALALADWLATRPEILRPEDVLVLADDSGLEVDALDGAPGVRSARFAALDTPETGGNSTDAANNAKLLRLLQAVPLDRRTARFRCVIALVAPPGSGPEPGLRGDLGAAVNGRAVVFDGACEGRILFEARGAAGFGYDPLFQPSGYGETFAELGGAVKNRISHRARALAKVQEWLATRPSPDISHPL